MPASLTRRPFPLIGRLLRRSAARRASPRRCAARPFTWPPKSSRCASPLPLNPLTSKTHWGFWAAPSSMCYEAPCSSAPPPPPTSMNEALCGSPLYMAPEILTVRVLLPIEPPLSTSCMISYVVICFKAPMLLPMHLMSRTCVRGTTFLYYSANPTHVLPLFSCT